MRPTWAVGPICSSADPSADSGMLGRRAGQRDPPAWKSRPGRGSRGDARRCRTRLRHGRDRLLRGRAQEPAWRGHDTERGRTAPHDSTGQARCRHVIAPAGASSAACRRVPYRARQEPHGVVGPPMPQLRQQRTESPRHRAERSRSTRYVAHPLPTLQRTITISRPIEEVFAFFADVSNDPKWRGHGVKEISLRRRDAPGRARPPEDRSRTFRCCREGRHGRRRLRADDRPRVPGDHRPLASPRQLQSSLQPIRHHCRLLRITAPLAGIKKAFMARMVQKNMA